MSNMCVNCGVLLGPVVVSLVLIIGGLYTRILSYNDLKKPDLLVPEIGIVILVLSFGWMFAMLFYTEDFNYLRLFAPALIGLGIISGGVYRLRNDINFTGIEYTTAGIALGFGAIVWIFWVLQAFS